MSESIREVIYVLSWLVLLLLVQIQVPPPAARIAPMPPLASVAPVVVLVLVLVPRMEVVFVQGLHLPHFLLVLVDSVLMPMLLPSVIVLLRCSSSSSSAA